MSTKLYVGSLPYSTTEQQLSELFSQHGTVQSAKVISDRYTGRSRGFGFVEMSTAEEAQKAIAAFNGFALDGRTLVVNEARPKKSVHMAAGAARVEGAVTAGSARCTGARPLKPAAFHPPALFILQSLLLHRSDKPREHFNSRHPSASTL